MEVLFDLKRRLKNLWPILFGLTICLYFGYHALVGERGVTRFLEVKKQLALANEIKQSTATSKELWQRKVDSLSPDSLDLDRLDERARAILHLVDKRDLVIITKEDAR